MGQGREIDYPGDLLFCREFLSRDIDAIEHSEKAKIDAGTSDRGTIRDYLGNQKTIEGFRSVCIGTGYRLALCLI
jgi:hypothetical protein